MQPGLLPDWISTAKHIAHRNADVDMANQERIYAAAAATVHIASQHFVQQNRLASKRDIPAWYCAASKWTKTPALLLNDAKTPNSDHDRVVADALTLWDGAPATLTFNMAQSAGLCNGTNGVVYDSMFLSDSALPIVLIQVTDTYLGPYLLNGLASIVPTAPKEVSWENSSSDLRVVRRGVPLRLAYAMTVH
ncbi:hypothetical protein ON010_g6751 [Phytophthora cinnamomi]|nr:hypothetical protein ON010_g6751 [Phytophthora cinnamomi]